MEAFWNSDGILVVQSSKTKGVDFEFWLAGWHLYKERVFFWVGKGLLDLDLLGPGLDLGSGFLGGVATSTGSFLCS